MDEELVMLEEQVSALQADVERLQQRLAESEALAAERAADLTATRQRLTEAEAVVTQYEAAASGRDAEIATLREAITLADGLGREAGRRYRELLLRSEPDLPANLVTGDTVDEIEASAERARQTVLEVRQRFEEQARATRVPAGAPPRGSLDLASLSPAEKIRAGLQQQSP